MDLGKEEIKKSAKEARKSLRELYIKYTQELYDVVNKIDTYLEVIENAKD